jgi:hypothetical protein
MSYQNDLWDSFEACSTKYKQGSTFSSRLHEFLQVEFGVFLFVGDRGTAGLTTAHMQFCCIAQERAKIEREYAKQIAKLIGDKEYNAADMEFGALQGAWEAFRSETANCGVAHQQRARIGRKRRN